MAHASLLLSVLLLSAMVAGCATNNADSLSQHDPDEPFNRVMFDANQSLDNHFALPVAKLYNRAMPELARDGIHNVLYNLDLP